MVAGNLVECASKIVADMLDSQEEGWLALGVQQLGTMANLDGLAGPSTGQDDDARVGEQFAPRHLAAPTKRLRQVDVIALGAGRDAQMESPVQLDKDVAQCHTCQPLTSEAPRPNTAGCRRPGW